MKQVLAELHSLISDLEDQGLTVEASSLQEVFVRVAQEAETDDLANDVKAILESHPVAEVIAEIAKQMDSGAEKDSETSSFAYGDEPGVQEPKAYREPKHVIVNEFVDQAIKRNMSQDDAYFMMNQRLKTNGHNTLSKNDFDEMVENKSIMNPNGTMRQDVVPFPEQTPEHRKRVLEESERQIEKMNEDPYTWNTAPGPQTSRL
jgi:hypothetical protein